MSSNGFWNKRKMNENRNFPHLCFGPKVQPHSPPRAALDQALLPSPFPPFRPNAAGSPTPPRPSTPFGPARRPSPIGLRLQRGLSLAQQQLGALSFPLFYRADTGARMAATLAFFFLVPSPTGTLQEATNPGNYGISLALTQPSTYKNPVAPPRPPLFISAPRSRQASPRPCDWISSRSRERRRRGTFYPWPCQRN